MHSLLSEKRVFSGTSTAHLWDLNFRHEPLAEVLQHDTVAGGEEGQDMADEVLLVSAECLPVCIIAAQVHFFRCDADSSIVTWRVNKGTKAHIAQTPWREALRAIPIMF